MKKTVLLLVFAMLFTMISPVSAQASESRLTNTLVNLSKTTGNLEETNSTRGGVDENLLNPKSISNEKNDFEKVNLEGEKNTLDIDDLIANQSVNVNNSNISETKVFIDSKEKLINFLNGENNSGATKSGTTYYLKGDFKLSSDDLPNTPLTVKGARVLGLIEEGKRPKITINKGTKNIGPLFKSLESDKSEKRSGNYKIVTPYPPLIGDFDLEVNGDVEGAVLAQYSNIDTITVENKTLPYESMIFNMNVEVNGSILPKLYFTSKGSGIKNYRACGLIMDNDEMNFSNIKLHVRGNIGEERELDGRIETAGLFVNNWSKVRIHRMKDCHVKIDGNLYALYDGSMANASDGFLYPSARAAGLCQINKSKVTVENSSSEITGDIIVKNGATATNFNAAAQASIGILNNYNDVNGGKTTYMTVSVYIEAWNIVSRDIILGGGIITPKLNEESSFYNLPEKIENPFKENEKYQIKNDNFSSFITHSNFSCKDVKIANGNMKAGSTFFGAAYDIKSTNVNVKANDIIIDGGSPLVCGYSVIAPDNEKISVNINDINVNEGKEGETNYSRVCLYTYQNHKSNNIKINAGNIKSQANITKNDKLNSIDLFANLSKVITNSSIYAKNVTLDGLNGNAYLSACQSLKNNDFTIYTNNRVLIDGNIKVKSSIESSFAGGINTVEESAQKFEAKDNGFIFKNIHLEGMQCIYNGFLKESKTENNIIENNNIQVLGDINCKATMIGVINEFNSKLNSKDGNSKIDSNTVLHMGNIISTDGIANSISLFSGTQGSHNLTRNATYLGGNIETKDNTNIALICAQEANNPGKVAYNTILLPKKSSLHNKNLKLNASKDNKSALEDNYLVVTDKGNRTAYPLKSKNDINYKETKPIVETFIKIRDFQNNVWTANSEKEKFTPFDDFKYIIKDFSDKNFYGVDKEDLLNSAKSGKTLTFSNYENRHLAVRSSENGPTCDIFGIPGGELLIVKFDKNDPSPNIIHQTEVEKGEAIGENFPTDPEREGYSFIEWNTKEDGSGDKFTKDTVVDKDTIIYAQWKKIDKTPKPEPEKPIIFKPHDDTPTYKVEAKKMEDLESHLKYIYGYPEGTFKPEGEIKRAEVMAIIARGEGYKLSDESKPNYQDAKEKAWYNKYINACIKAGILKEKEGEKLRAEEAITRAELADIISRITNKNDKKSEFTDIKGHWAEEAIDQGYGNGILTGYPDKSFKPDNTITRAETVIIINALYNRHPDKDYIDANENEMTKYTDLNNNHWAYYEIMEASESHKFVRIGLHEEDWKELIKDMLVK